MDFPGFKEAGEAAEGAVQPGMTSFPGGQQDALRHALWTAKMTQKYGRIPALVGSTGLEGIEQIVNALHPTRSLDDRKRVWDESVMDFKNNLSGARMGSDNERATQEELVRQLRSAPLEALPPYWNRKDSQ